MQSPKVSVIIPVYGVEPYIERCAISLFEQTLDDIEFIFVDDCTKDNSISILKNIVNNYPTRNVQIIRHDVNKGLPQARRTGILASRGAYIAHCDSDDWVDKDMYKLMYEKAVNDNLDIVTCDYYRSDGHNSFYCVKKKQSEQKLMTGPIWNQLVKSSLYKEYDIQYPVANKAEDGALMVQLSYFSRKRGYINKGLYYYFNNSKSITGLKTKESIIRNFYQECQNTDLRISFINKQIDKEKYLDEIILWKHSARNNLLPLLKDIQIYDLWKNTYPEINKQYLFISKVNIIRKLRFILYYFRILK